MVFEPKKRLINHDENKRLCTIIQNNREVEYYRNCSDILVNKELIDFKFEDINFLDFKLSEHCFEVEDYEDILWRYLNFGTKKKVLHLTNTQYDIFHLIEWNIFCEFVNSFEIKNQVQLEIHNRVETKFNNINLNLHQIKKINSSKFQIVDFHTIVSNNLAFYVNLKCDEQYFTENYSIIEYNPYADRTN